MTIGVGLFVGAGIPKGERVNTFVECGCCGAYHRTDFEGDCREDSERYWDLPDDAVIVYADDCEFEQVQPHEWHCVVHDVTKIAGTTEPVRCARRRRVTMTETSTAKCSRCKTREPLPGESFCRFCRDELDRQWRESKEPGRRITS